jgi:hypothetical protein
MLRAYRLPAVAFGHMGVSLGRIRAGNQDLQGEWARGVLPRVWGVVHEPRSAGIWLLFVESFPPGAVGDLGAAWHVLQVCSEAFH